VLNGVCNSARFRQEIKAVSVGFIVRRPGFFGGTKMSRCETAHEKFETRQLMVLCIGTTGLIVADALVWIYFWMI
jgi:hypothetical protein